MFSETGLECELDMWQHRWANDKPTTLTAANNNTESWVLFYMILFIFKTELYVPPLQCEACVTYVHFQHVTRDSSLRF